MYNRQWSNINSFVIFLDTQYGISLEYFQKYEDFTLIQIWSIQEYDLSSNFLNKKEVMIWKNA